MAGPLIDGQYAIPKQRVAPKPVAAAPKPTAPTAKTAQKWYFQGKVYYSYAGFNAAKNAYAAAVAQQTAAAAAARQRAAAAQQQASALARQRAEAAARSRLTAQAAALAQQRAAQLAAQQAAARQRAELEQRAIAARAEAQRKAAAAAKARELLALKAMQARRDASSAQLAAQRRRVEQAAQSDRQMAAQAARSMAYSKLKTQNQKLLQSQLRSNLGGTGQTNDVLLSSRETPGATARNQPLVIRRRAEQEIARGNWQGVAEILDQQSNRSAGRYFDTQLYERLQREYIIPAQKVRTDAEAVFAEYQALVAADDWEGLVKLAQENEELMEEFTRLYGEGRKPGALAPVQAALQRISQRRDTVILGTLAGSALTRQSSGSRWTGESLRRQLERESSFTSNEVIDPRTGRRTSGPGIDRQETVAQMGIDAFLKREQARERTIMEEAYKESVYRNFRRGEEQATEMARATQGMQGAAGVLGLTVPQMAGRIENIRDIADPVQAEVELGRLLQEIFDAWSRENRVDKNGELNTPQKMVVAQDKFMRDVEFALTGAQSERMSTRGKYLPNLGKLLESIQDPANSVINWISDLDVKLGPNTSIQGRHRQAGGPGQFTGDFLAAGGQGEVQGYTGAGKDELRVGGVSLWRGQIERSPEARSEYAIYQRAMQNPDPDVQAAAQRRWREFWLRGNVGFVADVGLDPLNVLGLAARPFQALNLASKVARNAGPGGILRQAGEYMVPRFNAGAGRNTFNYWHVREDQARVAVGHALGRPLDEVLNWTSDQWEELKRLARPGEAPIGEGNMLDSLTTSGMSRTQILNVVQQEVPNILRRYGVGVADPREAAKHMREILVASRRAGSAAAVSEELVGRGAAQRAADEALHAVRLSRGDLPGAERVAAANVAVKRADEAIAAAERELAELTGKRSEVAAQTRRAKGIPEDLWQQRQVLEAEAAQQFGSNAGVAGRLQKRISALTNTLDELKRQGVKPSRLAEVQGKLDDAIKELEGLAGLPQRRRWHEIQRAIRDIDEMVESAQQGEGVLKHFVANAGGPIRNVKQFMSRVNKKGGRNAWGSGGQAHLGKGLSLSLQDSRWGRRLKPTAELKAGASRVTTSMEDLTPVHFRLNTGVRIQYVESMGELRTLLRQHGIKWSGEAEDLAQLGDALKAAGFEGWGIRGLDKWRGPTAANLKRQLHGDQLLLFDPERSGAWIEPNVARVDLGPAEQALKAAREAREQAEHQLRRAKAEYRPNRVRKPTDVRGLRDGAVRREIEIDWFDEATGTTKKRKMEIVVEQNYASILDDVTAATTEYKAITDRAVAAIDTLTGGTANPLQIRQANKDLKAAILEVRAYEDEFRTLPDGNVVLDKPGLVTSRLQAVADYHRRIGGSPHDPSISQVSWAEIKSDQAWIHEKLRQLRTDLKMARSEREAAELNGRIAHLDSALKGLEYEAAVLSSARRPARKFGRDNLDRVTPAIRPQRLAHMARNADELSFGVTQDLNRLMGRIETVTSPAVRAADETVELIDDIAAKLDSGVINFRDAKLVDGVAEEVEGGFRLRSLKAGRELNWQINKNETELSVLDAWLIVEGSMAQQIWRAQYGTLRQILRREVMKVAADAGFKGKSKDLLRALRTQHHYRGEAPKNPLERYAELDEIYAKAIREDRGWTAEGQLRPGEKTLRAVPEEKKLGQRRDSHPNVIAVKLRVARETGTSMFEYDEMRGLFNQPLLRSRTSQVLQAEALAQSALKGTTFEEEFIRLRQLRAEREALRSFEEFATRPENIGLPMERVLRLFEERYILESMGSIPALRVSEYQKTLLETAWREATGFEYANEAMRQQWLQGRLVEVPGTKLATPEQLAGHAGFTQMFGHVPVRIIDGDMAAAMGGKAQTVVHDGTGFVITYRGKRLNLDLDLPSGIYITEDALKDPMNLWHEAFHTFWVNPANTKKVTEMDALITSTFDLDALMNRLELGHTAADLEAGGAIAEVVAEMYAMWKTAPDDWANLVTDLGDIADRAKVLGFLADDFAQAFGPEARFFGVGPFSPPLHNRAAMRDWAVEQGRWTPHTGEDIRTGAKVWTVDEERAFYASEFGIEPVWTDRDVLAVILRDHRAYQRAFREWGFVDDEFERIAEASGLKGKQLQDALVWGKDDFPAQRTWLEMRQWAIDRYGDLVVDADGNMTSMPWLMRMDDTEYLPWLARALASTDALDEQLSRAKPKMSPFLRTQYYDDQGFLRSAGLEMDPTLIGAGAKDPVAAVNALKKALYEATERRVARMRREGSFENGEWVHQEILNFSYDVTEILLADQAWRGAFRGRRWWNQLLHMAGFQRAIVSFNPAFGFLNLAESFGYKRALLAVAYNGWSPIGWSGQRWAKAIPNVETLADNEISRVFGLEGKARFMGRTADGNLSALTRSKGFVDDVVNAPVRASAWGEAQLRLDFARVNYGKTYEALMSSGKYTEEAADFIALAHARKINEAFFASVGNNPLMQALNQAVPFLSYRFKQFSLALEMSVKHPWIPLTLGKVQDEITAHNRRWYIEQHGSDLGFDEKSPQAHQLWIDTGDGEPLQISLWDISDWTRATRQVIQVATRGGRLQDLVGAGGEIIRIPHPLQEGIWATLTGGVTPWGAKGDWREVFWFVDLWRWMAGEDYADPRKQRDGIQILSQMFAFRAFGRLTEEESMALFYFGLRDAGRDDEARAYINSHPALERYFTMIKPFTSPRWSPYEAGRPPHWYAALGDEGRREFDEAYEGLNELTAALDANVFQYANEPWSDEYRAAKKERRALIAQYHLENPILRWSWGLGMTPARFAAEKQDWLVDEQVDEWYRIVDLKPKRADFETDLEYQQALVKFNRFKASWLEAHPAAMDRMYTNQEAITQAFHDQELMWSEILLFQSEVQLKIVEMESNLTGNYETDRVDREFISQLYDVKDHGSALLDAESYVFAFEPLVPGGRNANLGASAAAALSNFFGRTPPRVQSLLKIPGFVDYRYGNASRSEQIQMEVDEKYYGELGAMMDGMKAKDDFTEFWDELARRGLLDRYLKENPHKVDDYAYVQAIGNIVDTYGKFFWTGLFKPENAALLTEYLRRNPDKQPQARYMRGLDRIWSTIGTDFTRFYSELAKDPWMEAEYYRRNPDKAGKGANSAYGEAIGAIVKQATSGKHFYELLAANPWVQAEYFRRHPDKKAAQEANNEYFRWMESWRNALGADNFVGADEIWSQMPAWVQQRYLEGGVDRTGGGRSGGAGGGGGFSSPEARARFVQGQEYFAAMGSWVALLKAKEFVQADEYFKSLPIWMKEKYWAKHPDQRARMELTTGMLRRGAEYFLASGDDKLRILRQNPELMQWLNQHGGDEAAHRGLITQMYRAIPSSEPWLKRTFREKFPEVFSVEAAGERRLASVARRLAENPEMLPFYEKALKLQYKLYQEQLRLNKVPPKPWSIERAKRAKRRTRQRTSRLHSEWTTHRDIRKYSVADR